MDDWQTVNNTESTATALNIDFVDIAIVAEQQFPIHFTFFWAASNQWENRNYEVAILS